MSVAIILRTREKYREDQAASEIRQHEDMGPHTAASLKGA